MLEDLYKKLDAFREHIAEQKAVDKLIELGTKNGFETPEALLDFYRHFGNDREFLSAYYCFDKVEEVCVEEDKLTFGHTHQYASGLGIPTADLNTANEEICDSPLKIFLFHMAVWQVMNTNIAMAAVEMGKRKFDMLMKKGAQYFHDSELFTRDSRFRAAYYENVLMCYIIEEELLYVSVKEDEQLHEFEETFKLDLDW